MSKSPRFSPNPAYSEQPPHLDGDDQAINAWLLAKCEKASDPRPYRERLMRRGVIREPDDGLAEDHMEWPR